MPKAFVALGSNIQPERNLELALGRLAQQSRLLAFSTVWRTPPLERPEQDRYYNCVALIETALPPQQLKLEVLRKIESGLGRIRNTDRYAARTIDLDLILYGDVVMTSAEVTLPDPDILQRPFLASGILELDPELKLPGMNLHIAQVVHSLPRGNMEPMLDYTRTLRRKILK
jgi:2-amino-4-hydroxy-6-hydroxymethyldihydropteridine diphosphokinase